MSIPLLLCDRSPEIGRKRESVFREALPFLLTDPLFDLNSERRLISKDEKSQLLIEIGAGGIDYLISIFSQDVYITQDQLRDFVTVAVRKNNLPALRILLSDRRTIFSQSILGGVLEIAAKHDFNEIVEFLINYTDIQEAYFGNAFYSACCCGAKSVVRILINSKELSEEDLGLGVIKVLKEGNQEIFSIFLSERRIPISYLARIFQIVISEFHTSPDSFRQELFFYIFQKILNYEKVTDKELRVVLEDCISLNRLECVQAILRVNKLPIAGIGAGVRYAALNSNLRLVEEIASFSPITEYDRSIAICNAIRANSQDILIYLLRMGRSTEMIHFESVISYCFLEKLDKLLLTFIKMEILADCEFSKHLEDILGKLISKMVYIKSTYLKQEFTSSFIKLARSSESLINFAEFTSKIDWTDAQKDNMVLSLYLFFAQDFKSATPFKFLEFIKKNYKTFKDQSKFYLLLQLQICLSGLSLERFDMIFDFLILEKDYKKVLNFINYFILLSQVKGDWFYSFKKEELSSIEFNKILISEFIHMGYIDKGCDTFTRSRNPLALFQYCSRHQNPFVKRLIKNFIESVENRTFIRIRHENNSQRDYLSKEQTEAWQKSLDNIYIIEPEKEIKFDVEKFLEENLVTDSYMDRILNDKSDEFSDIKILIQDLKEKRYSNLCHHWLLLIEKLEDHDCHFKKKLQVIARNFFEVGTSNYLLVDTEDPLDIFLSGTDVQGSCQRVDGYPHINQCLLGYLFDGKIRMIAVKDLSGMIISRSFIKILVDNNFEPQIFLEPVYGDPQFALVIRRFAIDKAKSLGIGLYEFDADGEILKSFSNPAGREYEDGVINSVVRVNNGSYSVRGKLVK